MADFMLDEEGNEIQEPEQSLPDLRPYTVDTDEEGNENLVVNTKAQDYPAGSGAVNGIPYAEGFEPPTASNSVPDANTEDAPQPWDSTNFYALKERRNSFVAKAMESGDPVRAALAKEISDTYSVSRIQAAEELDYYQRIATREARRKALEPLPGTIEWFVNNPADAPIFQNDLENLAAIEKGFEAMRRIPVDYTRNYWSEFDSRRATPAGYDGGYEGYSPADETTGNAELDQKIAGMKIGSERAADVITMGLKSGYNVAKQGTMWSNRMRYGSDFTIGQMREDMDIDEYSRRVAQDGEDGLFYNAAQLVGTMFGSATVAVNEMSLGGAVVGGLLTAATGGAAAPLVIGGALTGAMGGSTFNIEAGLEYKQLIENNVDPEKARSIAASVGFANALIEVIGLRILGKAAAPVIQGIKAQFIKETAEALTVPTTRAALLQTAKSLSMGVGGEVVTEVLQELSAILGEELGRKYGGTNAPLTNREIYERLLEVAIATAKGTSILAIPGGGMVFASQISRVSASKQHAEALKTMVDATKNSEVLKNSPSSIIKYLADRGRETGSDTIYVRGSDLQQLMTQMNVTVEQLQEVVPDIGDQLAKVIDNGGDVKINLEDFVVKLGGTEFGTALMQTHARMNPEDMSVSEQIQYAEELNQTMADLKAASEGDAEAEARLREGTDTAEVKTVFDRAKAQYLSELNAASASLGGQYASGKFAADEVNRQAELAAAVVTRFATRLGLNPEQIEAIRPKIRSEGGAPKASLKPAETAKNEAQASGELTDKEYKLLETEEKRTAHGLFYTGIDGNGERVGVIPYLYDDGGCHVRVILPGGAQWYFDISSPQIEGFGSLEAALAKHMNGFLEDIKKVSYEEAASNRPEILKHFNELKAKRDAAKAAENADQKWDKAHEAMAEERPELFQRVSTAIPSEAAVKKGMYEDPMYSRQWADLSIAEQNKAWTRKSIAKLMKTPGIKGIVPENATDSEKVEAIVKFMTDNLVWLYKLMPPEKRDRAKLWYDGANKTAKAWAERYGLRLRQTAAVIAIFSPQNGWFNNMTNAERLLDLYFSKRREVPDEKLTEAIRKRCEKDKIDFEKVKGKTLEQVVQTGDYRAAAVLVRVMDAAFYGRAFNVLTPEGGVGGTVLTPKGKPKSAAFMGTDTIAKAISVIVDGSVANVYQQIGTQFKVRDFYNNIYDPSNYYAATIDTHAVGAALFSVVSSKSPEVEDNFGSPGNDVSGQAGTYPIYFEAYKRAANAVGVLPREMQSITWEAIRAIFLEDEKTDIRESVADIWRKADAGEITVDQAREQILSLVGGMKPLAWETTPFTDQITETYDRSGVELYDDIVQPPLEPTFAIEAAPNPDDAAAVAAWNKLTPDQKFEVTQNVVAFALNRVAVATKSFISETSMQIGGWLGDVNYSVAAQMDGGDPVYVGRALAYALRQQAVMILSGVNIPGTFNASVISIRVPGFTPDQIADLYKNYIDSAVDSEGRQYVKGMSTSNDEMRIVLDNDGREQEVLDAIKKQLESYVGPDLEVVLESGYAAFAEPLEETNGQADSADAGRVEGEGIQTAEGQPDSLVRLRDECDAKLREEIARAQERAAAEQPQQVNQTRLAPNGKPSNLPPHLYDYVRTSEFKAFFGDWENDPANASKIVDENGEPLVVYHGSDQIISDFNTTGFKDTKGTGAWFVDSEDHAKSYGPSVTAAFLNIRNLDDVDAYGQSNDEIKRYRANTADGEKYFGDPEEAFNASVDEDYTTVTDDTNALARRARKDGADGIVIRNVLDIGQKVDFDAAYKMGPATDIVVFDGANVRAIDVKPPKQDGVLNQMSVPAKPLFTFHNISEQNLKKASDLGGLAVPSLGIGRVDFSPTDFGEITLIGTKGMIDPASGTPVWSIDAYTNRFPDLDWSKSYRKDAAEKLAQDAASVEEKLPFGNSASSQIRNFQNFGWGMSELRSLIYSKPVFRYLFLKEKGISVDPVRKEAVELSAVDKKLKEEFDKVTPNVPSEMAEYSQAFAKVVEKNADIASNAYKKLAKKIRGGEQISRFFLDVLKRRFDASVQQTDPKKVFDEQKTADAIAKAAAPYQDELNAWIEEKANGLMGEPMIKVGRSLKPLTLANVVEAMAKRSPRNTESDHISSGTIRAAAGTRFRSMKSIGKNRDKITDSKTVHLRDRDITFDMQEFFQAASQEAGAYVGKIILLDAVSGKPSREKLVASMKKHGLSNPSAELVDQGMAVIGRVKEGITDYFEAKPQRAVMLSEFGGAVVPDNVSNETLQILKDNGIEVSLYKAWDNADRQSVVKRLAEKLQQARDDVLFQIAYHGSPFQFDKFTLDHIGEGEGAQAHGWGLYFAKDKAVAIGYKDRLSARGGRPDSRLRAAISAAVSKITDEWKKKGFDFDGPDEVAEVFYAIGLGLSGADITGRRVGGYEVIKTTGRAKSARGSGRKRISVEELIDLGGGVDEKRARVIAGAMETVAVASSWGYTPQELKNEIDRTIRDNENPPEIRDYILKELIHELDDNEPGNVGKVYAANVPDDDALIREEAALRDQPEVVKSAARKLIENGIDQKLRKMARSGGHDEGTYVRLSMALISAARRAGTSDMAVIRSLPEYDEIQSLTGASVILAASMASRLAQLDLETMTGRSILGEVEAMYGGPKAAALAFNAEGVKGVSYNGRKDGECVVIWDDEAIRVREILDQAQAAQQQQSDARGGYSIDDNTITLTKDADLSTVAHELSHWYMISLIKAYNMDGADITVRQDVDTLMKEFGIESVDAWNAMTLNEQRKYHERFAYWTEIYLATGKAPSKPLEGVFQRFGRWIRDVYRMWVGGARQALGATYRQAFGEELPELSGEVRRVLDRMLASEDMLSQAESAESLKPLFDQKPADMTDDDWREMMRERDAAEAEGVDKLNAARAKDEKWYDKARSQELRKIQRQGKEVRDNIREKVKAELEDEPIYKAIAALRQKGKETIKLDRDALKLIGVNDRTIAKLQILGMTRVGTLDDERVRITKDLEKRAKEGSVDIGTKAKLRDAVDAALKAEAAKRIEAVRNLIAPMMQFNSVQEMISAIVNTKPIDEAIEEETTRRAVEEHGDLFDDQKRDQLISDALRTESRARLIATELKYLMGATGIKARILREAARRVAADRLSEMKVKDVRPKAFEAAENRASRRAFKCLSKGDRQGAVQEKYNQLVQHEMARMANKVRKESERLDKIKTKAFKSDKKLAKGYETDIIACLRFVLTNVGLGKRKNGEPVVAEEYLKKVMAYDPEYAVGLKAILDKYPYKGDSFRPGDMSVTDFLGLCEDAQWLLKLSAGERALTLEGRKVDIDDAIDELLSQLQKTGGTQFAIGQKEAVTGKEERMLLLKTAKAYLTRVESWCIMMDGDNPNKPFQTYIFRPIASAAANYRVKNSEYQEKLMKLLKARIAEWEKCPPIDAKEIGYQFNRKAELIGALLHCGNASNKKKLLVGGRGEGRMWCDIVVNPDGSETVDYRRWDGMIARFMRDGIITKEDMDFCQAVWDLTESMKPMAQKAYKAYYGYYFEEIEATPLVTPFGIYRGGYVPAFTDPQLVPGKDKQLEGDMMKESEFFDSMPVTRPGFAQSRVEYNKPLYLDAGLIGGHISKVLKFAMIAPTVKDVQAIISSHRFKTAIDSIDPKAVSQMLVPWLKRSATQTVSTPTTEFGRWVSKLRGVAAMNLMAMNISNALQQTTGLTIAAVKVGHARIAIGMAAMISDPKGTYKRVTEASVFMKGRLADHAIEYQSSIEKMAAAKAPSKASEVKDWLQRHAYILQTGMQSVVDIPVWLAAYNQSIEAGRTEAEAVADADSVVRTTQSSFDPESVARVETGDPLYRALLVFYNYFNMQWNLLGERWALAKQKDEYGTFALDAVMIAVIPSVLSEIIAQSFSGFDTGDDDDWDAVDALRLLTSATFRNAVAMIPFGGNVINVFGTNLAKSKIPVASDVAQFAFGMNPYNDRVVSVPITSLIENAAKAPGSVFNAIEGDGKYRTAVKNMLDLLTLITGMPFGMIKRPASYAADLAQGEAKPGSTLDVARGFLSGKDVNAE